MLRLIDITNTVIKYRLDEYLFRGSKTKFLHSAGLGIRSFFGIKTINGSIGYRIRCALEELGPVFIKFGQMLSVRPDIIPPSIVQELNNLREHVEPFDSQIAISIIEQQLNKKINEVFLEFDINPVAAGSVAQVHYGKLLNGDAVAIKVLRPNIKKIITQDISVFRQAAKIAEVYNPSVRYIGIDRIIDELSSSIMRELDLELEACNAMRFAENMKDVKYVRVPKVYKTLSGKDVLIMEQMHGVPIDRVHEIQNLDINQLAARGVETLMLQVFRDGFFHADQHPGNLWIQPDGSRVYLDFGIMGELSKQDQKNLLKIFFFLFSKKHEKVIDAMVDAGWISHDFDKDILKFDIERIGQMFVNRKQKDFSLGSVITQLFKSLEKYGAKIPHQFTLLAKTWLVVEGVSKQIVPDLNIQVVAEPILLRYFATSRKQ